MIGLQMKNCFCWRDWQDNIYLYLLQERKGFGNWQDIAEMIATDKNKEEIEKHYDDVYLSGAY
jgi:transcriptional adapter 2-alpha